ncbi:tripartite motif-containing protein 60-like [Tamandua tetradactyla]|uniref:tripartite motif-containing protein 60-like n=1 Tax=Tamandua tetradactyla TaxID=48850 RepID=UPI0040545088
MEFPPTENPHCTMGIAASLTDLQAEASCPICLDFLKDPVTIDCGHNFCGSCIHQCWEELQDIFPCPICLHHCPSRNFKRNTQLSHMTGIVTHLTPRRSKRKPQEEKPFCEKHNQLLTLFCEQDLELLCSQCRVFSDCQNHHLISLEQAAASHRKKLKSYIKPLKKNIEDAEKDSRIQLMKSCKLKGDMEKWREELNSEFEQLKCFLEKEQGAIHSRLVSEEKNVEDKLTENQGQISYHLSTLKNLLREMTGKYVQADLDLLTGVESIHNRHGNLKSPKVFSYELQKESFNVPLQYFSLHKMMNIFKVDLTLDPETAYPNLIILEDRKTAIFGKLEPKCLHHAKAFTCYQAVRSCEGFDAGRHFWQVEVRGTGELALGVCRESFHTNTLISPSPNNGCWKVHLWTSTFDMLGSVHYRRIGIFLDYELGEVSFYNLDNRTYLYAHKSIFTEKIVPYFSVGPTTKCLIIRLVVDE